jgi:hypothetical protein
MMTFGSKCLRLRECSCELPGSVLTTTAVVSGVAGNTGVAEETVFVSNLFISLLYRLVKVALLTDS